MLTDAGEVETAYKMLENTEKPSWLYEIANGATTVRENWEGCTTGKNTTGSLNHYSHGAVVGWLFDTCAGIRVEGENRFTVEPVTGGTLPHAEASYKSLYGEVTSRWEKTESGMKFTVTVPPGCEATIHLPDGSEETVNTGVYEYVQ